MPRRVMEKTDSQPHPLPTEIDALAERYPFCIVWTPIPLLSWIFPFIGHVGICDSIGRIHDFEGPYNIGVDKMLFGNPVKYWDVSKMYAPTLCSSAGEPRSPEIEEACRRERREYDDAVAHATKHFRKTQMYNFFTNNCHSFVACALGRHPLSRGRWNMLTVAWGLAIHGRYVSVGRFFKAHLPFFILVTAIALLVAFSALLK